MPELKRKKADPALTFNPSKTRFGNESGFLRYRYDHGFSLPHLNSRFRIEVNLRPLCQNRRTGKIEPIDFIQPFGAGLMEGRKLP